MPEHVVPTNEDGSPVYAFGRRLVQGVPAFSEIAHLSSGSDKNFAMVSLE
jgi:hypothetical protein